MNTAQLFWTNLNLLGFQQEARKHDAIEFEAEMFRRGGPVRGLNVILYFCLSKADPAKTKEEFRAVYPIYDKGQEKDFRKAVFARLQQLERDGELRADSVRLSDLTSAKGDRLYGLLWQLSSRALAAAVRRMHGTVPRLSVVDPTQAAQYTTQLVHGAAHRLAAARLRLQQTVAWAEGRERALQHLAQRLQQEVPSNAASIAEGGAVAADTATVDAVRGLWRRLEALPLTEVEAIASQSHAQTLQVTPSEPLPQLAQQYQALLQRLPEAAALPSQQPSRLEATRPRAAALRALAARLTARRAALGHEASPARAPSSTRLAASLRRVQRTHPSANVSLSPARQLFLDGDV